MGDASPALDGRADGDPGISRVLFRVWVGTERWEKELLVPFVPTIKTKFRGFVSSLSSAAPRFVTFDASFNRWEVDLQDEAMPDDPRGQMEFRRTLEDLGWRCVGRAVI